MHRVNTRYAIFFRMLICFGRANSDRKRVFCRAFLPVLRIRPSEIYLGILKMFEKKLKCQQTPSRGKRER